MGPPASRHLKCAQKMICNIITLVRILLKFMMITFFQPWSVYFFRIFGWNHITLTLVISRKELMVELLYLICMILVTSPCELHHAVTFTYDIDQGQVSSTLTWLLSSEVLMVEQAYLTQMIFVTNSQDLPTVPCYDLYLWFCSRSDLLKPYPLQQSLRVFLKHHVHHLSSVFSFSSPWHIGQMSYSKCQGHSAYLPKFLVWPITSFFHVRFGLYKHSPNLNSSQTCLFWDILRFFWNLVFIYTQSSRSTLDRWICKLLLK